MASTRITDYVGHGLASARPTTPPIAAGASAVYVATDTHAVSFWDGTTWVAASASSILGVVNAWTAAQRGVPVALTDAATIASDFSLGNNFSVTLGGNRTLGNPSNVVAGQAGQLVVKQDGTGSRTLAYASDWKFPGGTAPTLSTAANATDILSYYVIDATHIAVSFAAAFA
jgi:hypothetical protein